MEPTVEKTKNPKRVEQGKKLAEHNRERREREKLEREERKKLKEQENEQAFNTWKKQHKDEPLTIQDNSPPVVERTSSFLPALALVFVGVGAGAYWYYNKPATKGKPRAAEKPPAKTKFVDRIEKYQR